jgi:hypothetical protein
MPRISPLEYDQLTGEARTAYEHGIAKHGRMTNMKRTLLHSMPSYNVLLEWYPLFDVITPFLGERLGIIFAHALSSENDCLICTVFMRRILIDWGEDPGKLELDEKGQAIVEFGRAIAKQGNRVSDELYGRIANYFITEQIVALTGFASIMIATNIVNNVLEVDLDEYLYTYQEGQPLPK